MLDYKKITSRAKEAGGFTDSYDGIRLLTVGRLAYQKAYDIAIDAMKIIKDSGCKARWYVLGEGSERRNVGKKDCAVWFAKGFFAAWSGGKSVSILCADRYLCACNTL